MTVTRSIRITNLMALHLPTDLPDVVRRQRAVRENCGLSVAWTVDVWWAGAVSDQQPADRRVRPEEPVSADMLIRVDTPNGEHVRVVPPASALADGIRAGTAAELVTRSAAAIWGMPDFIYEPVTRAKGNAQRELGDGLLIHGRAGVVIQVKHREVPTGSPEREKSWLRKMTAGAIRQINGSVRSLEDGDVVLRNARGRTAAPSPDIEWSGVVILDHPSPPSGAIVEVESANVPTIALLRRDWEFLFDQLRSTHAVIGYLNRVSVDESVELGHEPVRYYELADADEKAAPGPTPEPGPRGWEPLATPLLPKTPAAEEDTVGHLLIRAVMEDIATSGAGFPESARLEVLSEIDQLPVAYRASLGRHLTDQLKAVSHAPEDSVAWAFRLCRFTPPQPQLLFGVCNQSTDLTREAFRQWATLRHHEHGEAVGDQSVHTVAVLLALRGDGVRPFDTTMFSVRGDIELIEDELEGLRKLWNTDRPSPYSTPPVDGSS